MKTPLNLTMALLFVVVAQSAEVIHKESYDLKPATNLMVRLQIPEHATNLFYSFSRTNGMGADVKIFHKGRTDGISKAGRFVEGKGHESLLPLRAGAGTSRVFACYMESFTNLTTELKVEINK